MDFLRDSAYIQHTLQDRFWVYLTCVIILICLVAFLFGFYAIVLRIRNIRKAEHWQRLEDEWKNAILDVLSGDMDPAELRQRVREKDTLYFVDFLLRFARRLQGREREILGDLARPFLGRIAERVKGGDPERRARAVQTLSALAVDDYAQVIVEALDDPSPLVAMVAARTLARRDHPEHAEAILDRLRRFRTWSPNYLATMLAAIGPDVGPALREALADPQRPPSIRSVAAEALRRLNDFAAADMAARVLETETDRDLLAASLRLLARAGRPEHLPSIRRLCRSNDFVVRAHALEDLGILGEAEDLRRLRQSLEDASPWVAIRAAEGLKNAGDRETLEAVANSDHPRADLARQVLVDNR